jgi:transposase
VPPKTPIAVLHECEWKAIAENLQSTVDVALKRIAELERCFARRSEKRKKMPAVARLATSPQAQQATREERATARDAKMEVIESTVHVDTSEKHCDVCGDGEFRAVGGGKTSEVVHYVAGHFRKHVTRRETVACKCGERIVTAEAPQRWCEKTQYDASFVAYLITQKCAASMPLYRLETMFSQIGIPTARSTMNDLVQRAATTLAPLRAHLITAIQCDAIVHIDETSFKMTAQKKLSQMWAFVGENLTHYCFDLSRAKTVPISILGDSPGTFVADDYAGYDALERKGHRVRGGCMAHARRNFFEAGEVPEAQAAMAIIACLYAVEAEAARRKIKGTPEHAKLRNTQSRPMYYALMRIAHALMQEHGPKTLLGKAGRYAWTNIRTLGQFLRNPRVPLDNNIAENALRIIALGRKNFLFVHSKEAGERIALLYSLTTSCTRLGVNPIEYFTDVLNRIESEKVTNLRELLPDRWKPRTPAPNQIA